MEVEEVESMKNLTDEKKGDKRDLVEHRKGKVEEKNERAGGTLRGGGARGAGPGFRRCSSKTGNKECKMCIH